MNVTNVIIALRMMRMVVGAVINKPKSYRQWDNWATYNPVGNNEWDVKFYIICIWFQTVIAHSNKQRIFKGINKCVGYSQ